MTEITQWAFEQWAPEVNPKLDFSESGQSGDLGHPTGGKWVDQELSLLQAARGCQSPLWAVTSSSCWYNYLTPGCSANCNPPENGLGLDFSP